MHTFSQARQHETGGTFIRAYAAQYGTLAAMAVLRAAVAGLQYVTLGQDFAARVAGMCDALLERVWVRSVRTFCREHGVRVWATPRASMRGAEMIADGAEWTPAEMAESLMFKGLEREQVNRILDSCPLPALGSGLRAALAETEVA